MRTRQQITLHLDPPLVTALDAEAGKRGLTASRAANGLLRRALIEEGTEQLVDTVKARLDRLDRRDGARARRLHPRTCDFKRGVIRVRARLVSACRRADARGRRES